MKVQIKYLLSYILVFGCVVLADAITTLKFIDQNIGEEINPWVDTSSLQSILVSPLQVIYLIGCIGIVILAEFSHSKTAMAIRQNQFLLFVYCLPYFYLIAKIIAILNNTILLLGYHRFISAYFEFFGENAFIGMIIAFVTFAAIFLPLCEKYLKAKYQLG